MLWYGVKFRGKEQCFCPFHTNTKSPAMSIKNNFYYCHNASCGKHGTVIDFVMEQENLTAFEAAKFLNDRYNLGLIKGNYNSRQPDERQKEIETARKRREEDREIIASFEFALANVSNRIGALLCEFNLAPPPTDDYFPPLLALKNRHYDLLLHYQSILHGDNFVEKVEALPIVSEYVAKIENEVNACV
jgi:hypothetical protein